MSYGHSDVVQVRSSWRLRRAVSRVLPEVLVKWNYAARVRGLSLSRWLSEVGSEAAERELAGLEVPLELREELDVDSEYW